MKGKLFILIAVGLIIFKFKKLIIIENIWIVSFFLFFVVLNYISIHNKNKDNRTPRPVYVVRGS